MRSILLAILLSLASAGSFAADKISFNLNEQIDQTNFKVNMGCSGTLIDRKARLVLTANHCVEDQYETIERETIGDDGIVTKDNIRRLKPGTVRQIFFQGPSEVREIVYRTRIKAVDKDKDLALVQILAAIPNRMEAKLACAAPARGDRVFIVGNPMGNLYSSVVPGMVSSVQRDYGLLGFDGMNDREGLMQIAGGVVGGNSGGAVYNDHGELVGVPVMGHRFNEVLGFAVPLDTINTFLDSNDLGSLHAHCATDP